MKFSWLVAVSLVAVTGGCRDATAPSQNVTALYVLESIDAQPLPATFSPRFGEAATILWATLNLDAAGNATTVERRRTETPTGPHESTDARITDYEIDGEMILIGPPCPLDSRIDCVPKRTGQITPTTLTLSADLDDPPGLTYLYRLTVTMD